MAYNFSGEEIVAYPRRLVAFQLNSQEYKILIVNLEDQTIEYEEKIPHFSEKTLVAANNDIYAIINYKFTKFVYDPEIKAIKTYTIDNINTTDFFAYKDNFYIRESIDKVYELNKNAWEIRPIFQYNSDTMVQIMKDDDWSESYINMIFPNGNMIIHNSQDINIEIDRNYQIIQKYPEGNYNYIPIDEQKFIQHQRFDGDYILNTHIAIAFLYHDGGSPIEYQLQELLDDIKWNSDKRYYYIAPPIILENKDICMFLGSVIVILNERGIVSRKYVSRIYKNPYFKMFLSQNISDIIGQFIYSSHVSDDEEEYYLLDLKESQGKILYGLNDIGSFEILHFYPLDKIQLLKKISPVIPSFLPQDLINLIYEYL